jgi:hypothetical protein
VATLPKTQRSAWTHYLKRSERQLQADQAFLCEEMRQHGLKTPVVPPTGKSLRGTVLNKPADWFGQPDARRIADIVVSFQTPAGGWSKNLNLTNHARAPGEHFAPDNESRRLTSSDFDTSSGADWSYVGTFDNDATVFELRYLAKVISVVGPRETVPYRQSFLRGLDYVLAAQYPNGGWPQVWPLQGGYHDAITYNDNAMINVMSLLRDVSNARDEFAFVPVKTRGLVRENPHPGNGVQDRRQRRPAVGSCSGHRFGVGAVL